MFIGQIDNIKLSGRAEMLLTYNAYTRASKWAKELNVPNNVKSVVASSKEALIDVCKAQLAEEVIPASLVALGVTSEHFVFDINYFDASTGRFWSTSPQTIRDISN